MGVAANSFAITGFILAVAIASSCGDPATAPPATPVVRTYDVTTVLDEFYYETSAPDPDCPGAQLHCSHVRAFSGATPTGTLTTPDSFPTLLGSVVLNVTASFGGQFCDSIDRTGCLHVGPIAMAPYQGTLSVTANTVSATVDGPLTDVCHPVVELLGVRVGDSLSGSVKWYLCPNRSPPTHTGQFIARLHK
jgi:hypothetical protein